MDLEYKLRKEDFVANLSGGSLSEITCVTLVAPAAVLLWSALHSRRNFFAPYGPAAFFTDFLLNVGAILFSMTAYSSAPALLSLLLILPAALISSFSKPLAATRKSSVSSTKANGNVPNPSLVASSALPVQGFLTTYRGAMMVVTCIAILAVDFRVFPRRFAKVENWGTSLMDLGVGSFVFSAGVVSARSILKSRLDATKRPASSFVSRLMSSIRHSIPLLVLGLIRLYTVKELDYAEHVTEYGVHWNFFFTLAFLPPFVELADVLTTYAIPSYEMLSVLFVLVYEIVLSNTTLKQYILVSPRGPDLLSKNREGVFSFIGYLSIFLAGRGTGMTVIPGIRAQQSKGTKPVTAKELAWKARKSLIQKLVIQSACWSLLFAFSTAYFGLGLRVSRRLANLPYVLWINAFNNAQLLLFCLIETVYFPEAYRTLPSAVATRSASVIMQAFNKNGLAVFLVANLMTGLVNLSLNTLDMTSLGAMAVLVGYSACVTGVALLLDRTGIKIKV
ncbi:GPI-anchored wall transfer protein 1 [Endocarpon pusillum Z07020]|uniref:GPI-anchored wall transfer protein n=1 Tax=Endocarpon pusillum (strain Z07020 / HMAS-L-300199) TaxID=1263415 RepID=U1HPD1_ENDPU|nr:GPI-anchored wall transfer protein 1 [Endocarpon pusillum Z07020]ERF70919.1 GPI-anchored wall transfer protein 1 [Endocarpon pusillum Z07020]